MPSQLPLPGIAAPAPATDRFFFALLPDETAAQSINRCARELQRAYGLRSRLLAPHRLHLSLQHLGNHVGFPASWVDAARRAAARIDFPAFDLCFDRVLTLSAHAREPRPLPCVMTAAFSASLHRFHTSLGLAMRDSGIVVQSRSFTPHITMFYDPLAIEERPIEAIYFMVREFVIIHTLIGTGRRYELLGRWLLRS
ncbi:MAG: 2'-5' RNA ligase family protein [Steroidobacteraceae bacterium]